jgi:hypothetical protein
VFTTFDFTGVFIGVIVFTGVFREGVREDVGASYGKGTSGGRVLTDRGSHSLPTQVRFSTDGKCGKHLSGKFCAWLMGYDAKYLGYLVDYE